MKHRCIFASFDKKAALQEKTGYQCSGFCIPHQVKWDNILSALDFLYRSTKNTTNKFIIQILFFFFFLGQEQNPQTCLSHSYIFKLDSLIGNPSKPSPLCTCSDLVFWKMLTREKLTRLLHLCCHMQKNWLLSFCFKETIQTFIIRLYGIFR